MTELIDKKYYEEHPQYSEVDCLHCKGKTLRLKGIVSSYDIPDKTLYECEKCGQQAYIEVEWLFTIRI